MLNSTNTARGLAVTPVYTSILDRASPAHADPKLISIHEQRLSRAARGSLPRRTVFADRTRAMRECDFLHGKILHHIPGVCACNVRECSVSSLSRYEAGRQTKRGSSGARPSLGYARTVMSRPAPPHGGVPAGQVAGPRVSPAYKYTHDDALDISPPRYMKISKIRGRRGGDPELRGTEDRDL